MNGNERYIEFKNVIIKIFKNAGFDTDVDKDYKIADRIEYIDLVISKNNFYFALSIDYNRSITEVYLRDDTVYHIENSINAQFDEPYIVVIPILVTNTLFWDYHDDCDDIKELIVIDIQNLLYIVNSNMSLKNELLSTLEFSVRGIIPKKPNTNLFPRIEYSFNEDDNNNSYSFIATLKAWSPSENKSRKYEDLCTDILKHLFIDDLDLWKEQEKSNDDLYRFDMISKIKNNNTDNFWQNLIQFFNSKYIIFEYKNYSKEVSQKEIYTTEKYLYAKALRSVAIIISCKGASINADKAIKGSLRESGKLIISIDNNDLIRMLEIKEDNKNPSDYLYDKLDYLLINLEK